MCMKLLSWADIDARGDRRSKSQKRRDIRNGKFPPPAGYNGRSPFWTEDQWDAHVKSLIAQHAAKVEAE
jgi:hypothetical protein